MSRRHLVPLAGLTALAFPMVVACGAGPASQTAPPPSAASTPSASTAPSASASTPTAPASSAKPATTPSAQSSTTSSKSSAKPSSKPKPAAMMKQGSSGEKVRELQVRLRQLDWFGQTITGTYGSATTSGVKGFQGKRELPKSGEVDDKTWTKLSSMTDKPTRDAMHNILRPGKALLKDGSSGDDVRDLQARLKQLDWYEPKITGNYGSITSKAVKGFQAKRNIPVTGDVDRRTLDRLTAMTRTPTKDEKHNVTPKAAPAKGLDSRCMTGRAMCINKSTSQLVWVIDGEQQLRVDVRFGSELTPTREGSFTVGWKSRHHVSTIYHTPMPYAMFFSGGQAVHYSSDFAARGYNGASHGCVNVRNLSGISSLFSQARVGDKVIVYRS